MNRLNLMLAGTLALAACDATETDPLFSRSAVAQASPDEMKSWTAAYDWGDHHQAGYLSTEADPKFAASPVARITDEEIEDWSAAVAWGDHNAAGYVRSESDPQFASSPAATIAKDDVARWSTAVSWGNHAAVGYLKAESDPLFATSAAATVGSADIARWQTAAGWGDHNGAGYVKSETDPQYAASPAASITSDDVTHWKTGYGWGDHATAGYLASESDPTFTASPAAAVTANQIARWDTAADWGDHATAGYARGDQRCPAGEVAVGFLANGAIQCAPDAGADQWSDNPAGVHFNGGHVGIGTDTPAALLDVKGSGLERLDVNADVGSNAICGQNSLRCFQSFTITAPGELTKIRTTIWGPTASPGHLRLYAGACAPNCANPIAQSNPGSNRPSSVGLADFTFATPVPVSKDDVFTFQVVGEVSYAQWGGSSYAGGSVYSDTNGTNGDLAVLAYVRQPARVLVSDEGFVYFGGAAAHDGAWRMGALNGNFVLQVRLAGTWTTKETWLPQ